MGSIATSYERVAEILEQIVKPDNAAGPSTPARKKAAINQAMNLEADWLRGRDLARLIDVLGREGFAADGYVQVMENTKLRKNWVRVKLDMEDPLVSDEE